MSKKHPLDDLTLEDYNKTLEPRSLQLIERLADNGVQIGFLLQRTDSGDIWFGILHNELDIAILQSEAFIQGGQRAVVRCQEEIQEFLASVQDENKEDIAPDDPAKATAFFEWRRRRDSLKMCDVLSEKLKQARWPIEIERLVDPETSLVSYALVDKTGYHVWTIPHADQAVVGLVLTALTKGVIEGEYLATQQMNLLEPTKTLDDEVDRLN